MEQNIKCMDNEKMNQIIDEEEVRQLPITPNN